MAIKLSEDWTRLYDKYADDHQDPRNQACHKVGIPLIAASLPVGATIIGLPLAASMFTVGWTFQFVGHAFEGKKPSFVDDKRSLVIGLVWWFEKVGVHLVDRDESVELHGAAAAELVAHVATSPSRDRGRARAPQRPPSFTQPWSWTGCP